LNLNDELPDKVDEEIPIKENGMQLLPGSDSEPEDEVRYALNLKLDLILNVAKKCALTKTSPCILRGFEPQCFLHVTSSIKDKFHFGVNKFSTCCINFLRFLLHNCFYSLCFAFKIPDDFELDGSTKAGIKELVLNEMEVSAEQSSSDDEDLEDEDDDDEKGELPIERKAKAALARRAEMSKWVHILC